MPTLVKVNFQSVNKGCGAARDLSVKNSDAAFGGDLFLADLVVGNLFDRNASGTRQLSGALAKGFGKSPVVKVPDVTRRQKSRHPPGIAGSRQCSRRARRRGARRFPSSAASSLSRLVPASPAQGCRRRRHRPKPARAVPTKASEAGSGTVTPVSENAALKVGNGEPSTMS